MTEEPAHGKNDIDFDELDKAVSSLMDKVSGEEADDSEKTKTLDINTTLKVGEKPHYDTLGKAAETIGNETLVTDAEVELVEDLTKLPDEMQLPVAVTKAEAPAAPAAPATPTSTLVPTPTPTPSSPPAPAVKRPSSGRFMDMINPKADMRTASPLPTAAAPPRQASAPMPAPVAPVVATPAPQALGEVPQTPFLPDAKVEKRPLGNVSVSTVDDKKAEPAVEAEPLDGENAPKTDNGASDDQRVLNAGDFEKETLVDQELTKIEATEASVEEPQTIEKVESGDTENLKNPPKPTYEEKIDDKQPADGAIYDTKDYHQPINHPAKQKSGWGRVFIILLIIILAVAAAGGAYLYFGLHP